MYLIFFVLIDIQKWCGRQFGINQFEYESEYLHMNNRYR